MKSARSWIRAGLSAAAWVVSLCAMPSAAQVGPSEISNPQLKALQQAHLRDLVDLNRAIRESSFPFVLNLSRYAGLDPQQQIGADARGLEFVSFHGHVVLKVTGNYNAAYSAELLTANERANRVFDEVIVPILRLLPDRFGGKRDFDTIGFEIAYHTRRRNRQFTFEGREILVAVMDRADATGYAGTGDAMKRQAILNRSEIYLDGKPFGMALGVREPFDVAGLRRLVPDPASNAQSAIAADSSLNRIPPEAVRPAAFQQPAPQAVAEARPTSTMPRYDDGPPDTRADLSDLERKYRRELEGLGQEGVAKYHFVAYAPPCFVKVRNRTVLQVTLRNPNSFDTDATSIYRRAAQGFDLFFAPELKPVLDLIPHGAGFDDLDVTILNEFALKSGKSSEALEFIFPLDALRQFAAADVTNQELINRSVVLVNGVRIALNLQQVE